MNKHAQNLRALPFILPVNTDPAILDTLARAADEIDRLQSYLPPCMPIIPQPQPGRSTKP